MAQVEYSKKLQTCFSKSEIKDIKHLFSLFFTRKVRGGRGVGLYLCRANLAAGGHTINYATDNGLKKLPGANFVIDFKGAKYV